MDKLWSIVPVLYVWMCIVDTRTLVMASLITLWGIRLTYNFLRRGGYTWPYIWKGEEDYRWSYVRQGAYMDILTQPWIWHIFNLVFISFYQNILLFLITTPCFAVYTMYTSCQTDDFYVPFQLWGMDGFLCILILSLILLETVADNQQFHFQSNKAKVGLVGVYADGFCQTGLFAYARKPHYAAEQAIWICFYFFSLTATKTHLMNYSIVGCVLLCLLFQGSAALTESITVKKYTKYAEYQKKVPLFIPRFTKNSNKAKKY